MRRVFVSLIGTVLVVAATACGSSTPAATTPTPTPTPATVTAVAVSGPTSSTTNFQVTATAKMSDGTSTDVTLIAKWESSDATIATVASNGLVVINASGTVTLKATYQTVSGTMQTTINKPALPKFSLGGSVWEVDPNAHKIAGALVTVTSGADAGAAVMSDVNGNYAFPSLTAGTVALVATKDGYLVSSPEGITLSSNAQADVFMAPTPPKDANGNTATARCADRSWSWAQTRDTACTANGGIEYPVCPGVLCPNNLTSQTSTLRRR
jgi:hypothetical protein